MITVGSKVKLKDVWDDLAKTYHLTLGKEYVVIKTSKFWCSATIVNDIGKNTTFNIDRFDLVVNPDVSTIISPIDFDSLIIGSTRSGKTRIPGQND